MSQLVFGKAKPPIIYCSSNWQVIGNGLCKIHKLSGNRTITRPPDAYDTHGLDFRTNPVPYYHPCPLLPLPYYHVSPITMPVEVPLERRIRPRCGASRRRQRHENYGEG